MTTDPYVQAAEIVAITSVTTSAPTRRCLQPDAKGEPCQNHMTQFFEKHGWRCRFHMPEGASWPHARRGNLDYVGVDGAVRVKVDPEPLPPPNDGSFETYEDARAMMAWAGKELACGRMTESMARGITNIATRIVHMSESIDGKNAMEEIEQGLVRHGALKGPK